MTAPPERLRSYPKSRVWFWKPQWWWGFKGSWSPVHLGHDEFARQTICLGWSVTGRIIIALRYCGNPECYLESLDSINYYGAHSEDS